MPLACRNDLARAQVGHHDVLNITIGTLCRAAWTCAVLGGAGDGAADAEGFARASPDDGAGVTTVGANVAAGAIPATTCAGRTESTVGTVLSDRSMLGTVSAVSAAGAAVTVSSRRKRRAAAATAQKTVTAAR